MDNLYKGSDVLKYLESIIPDTPEVQLLGEQEAMRIELTQVLRDARKKTGMTHSEIAAAINKDVEWVKRVEDYNYPLVVDDFVAYMYALKANFDLTVKLPNGETVKLDKRDLG